MWNGREGLRGVLLLSLVLHACGTEANSGLGRMEYTHVNIIHSSIAEKKRTGSGKFKGFLRDYLLKPETWKAAVAALDFGLKLFRVAQKVWEHLS